MSPAPELDDENNIIKPAFDTPVTRVISSSDEFDHNPTHERDMDLGSLAMDSMDNVQLSEDDQTPTVTQDPVPNFTVCSAPSTPTGERDPPVAFRRASVTAMSNNQPPVPTQDIYQHVTSDANSYGFMYTIFGCLKPIFSAVNKIGENISPARELLNFSAKKDEWEIPIDSITNGLVLIGTGKEGSVFRSELNGRMVACKCVQTEEETRIKSLRKLNHANIIKFHGVAICAPLYYIVMEYCPYGSLYDVLTSRRERCSYTKPTQVLDWAKQISSGVHYLHLNKIIHRDLKSPNILIAENYVLKISDFGSSKKLEKTNGRNKSINGTAAWMAPEVIRQESCSEKIDVWSFGVVLWEILTCQVPYHNIDPNAIIYAVGKGTLTLPIPSSAPEGLKLLMSLCWKQKPQIRPSFQQIIKHLAISEREIFLFEQEQEYFELTQAWFTEINEQLARLPTVDISATLEMSQDELLKRYKEELQHTADIRAHYLSRVCAVNTLYMELSSLMMQLEKREQEIKKKERLLDIRIHSSSNIGVAKKRIVNSVAEARKQSLELIKSASFGPKDPLLKLSQISTKPSQATKPLKTSILNDINASAKLDNSLQSASAALPNQDSSSGKNVLRRKKTPGHHRNNSRGSATSWAPPSLSAIADQEQKRAGVYAQSNKMEMNVSNNKPSGSSNEIVSVGPSKSTIPSISAAIDLQTNTRSRQLNPSALDARVSTSTQVSPQTTYERPVTLFTYAQRKSSSSEPEDVDSNQHNSAVKARRRRNIVPNNNNINSKLSSPSSASTRSNKSVFNDQQAPPIDTTSFDERTVKVKDEHEQNLDLRKSPKSVNFQLSPSMTNERNLLNQQRQLVNRHTRYSSSEEGEVEEVPSDHYVLDDEKHRAKHENLNRESTGIFSSESELYNESNQHSTSSKSEGILSDEGGHLSDDRPASRESLNSEPEHEWLSHK